MIYFRDITLLESSFLEAVFFRVQVQFLQEQEPCFRGIRKYRKWGTRWASFNVMVTVLPKADLTHEGLLLGEAHLIPHSPRWPPEGLGIRPSKVGPEARTRKSDWWVRKPGHGTLTGGSENQDPKV